MAFAMRLVKTSSIEIEPTAAAVVMERPRRVRGLVDEIFEGRLHYLQRVHREYESIYNAIRQQDTEAARAAMRTHLSNSREQLRQAQNPA